MPDLYHYFLSYSRESSEDSQFALKIARDLRAAGAAVWIDALDLQPWMDQPDLLVWMGQRDLEPGQALEKILNASAGLLIVLSPASVQSAQVIRELSIARKLGRRVEAILFRNCELRAPFDFDRPLDFRTDYEAGLHALITRIRESPFYGWGGCGGVPEDDLESEESLGEYEKFLQLLQPSIGQQQQQQQQEQQHSNSSNSNSSNNNKNRSLNTRDPVSLRAIHPLRRQGPKRPRRRRRGRHLRKQPKSRLKKNHQRTTRLARLRPWSATTCSSPSQGLRHLLPGKRMSCCSGYTLKSRARRYWQGLRRSCDRLSTTCR